MITYTWFYLLKNRGWGGRTPKKQWVTNSDRPWISWGELPLGGGAPQTPSPHARPSMSVWARITLTSKTRGTCTDRAPRELSSAVLRALTPDLVQSSPVTLPFHLWSNTYIKTQTYCFLTKKCLNPSYAIVFHLIFNQWNQTHWGLWIILKKSESDDSLPFLNNVPSFPACP